MASAILYDAEDKLNADRNTVGNPFDYTDDAVELCDATSSTKPNKRDPAGRTLQSNVKELVDKLVSAHENHKVAPTEQAAHTAQGLSQCDCTAVAMWLKSRV